MASSQKEKEKVRHVLTEKNPIAISGFIGLKKKET